MSLTFHSNYLKRGKTSLFSLLVRDDAPFHDAVCSLRQSVCVIINPEDHFRLFFVYFYLWQTLHQKKREVNGTYVMRPLWWRISNSFFTTEGFVCPNDGPFSSRDTFCVNIDSLVLRRISGHLSKWTDNMFNYQ